MPIEDLHVHSTFSDGRDEVAINLAVAQQRGLERIGCVDHVRRDTDWVPHFASTVRAAAKGLPMEVLVGVEAKLLNSKGHLDLPDNLRGVDRVYIADHQFPMHTRVAKPQEVRRALRRGRVAADVVTHYLCLATARALRACPRPAVIAHLFSLLPKVGLQASDVADEDLDRVIEAAVATSAWLELDERWRCPGEAVAARFHQAGVPIVLSTDSHTSDAIGRYDWAPRVFSLATGRQAA